MELTIQSVNFDASERLKAFAEKKVNKLERFADDIIKSEVIMKVVRPDAPKNKEVSIKLHMSSMDGFANKSADTFEEAIDLSVEALEKQIRRSKERK